MAFYYVKSGGTATGDGGRYATAKANNSWATEFSATSEYYGTLEAAENATTGEADGDYILASHLHNAAYFPSTNDVIFGAGIDSGAVTVMSVDDAAIQEYKPGATEDLTDTAADFKFNGEGCMMGFKLRTGDNVIGSSNDEAQWTFHDIHLQSEGALDVAVYINNYGCKLVFYNCVIEFMATNSTYGAINVTRGSIVEWHGGGIYSAGNGLAGKLFAGNFDNGGGRALFFDADFSTINTSSAPLMYYGISTVGTTHPYDIGFFNCKFHPDSPAHPVPNSDFGSSYHRYTLVNTNDATDGRENYLYHANGAGLVETNNSVYVTGSDNFDGETLKQSFQIKTGTKINPANPFRYKLFKQYVDLSTDSTSKIIVHLVTDASLLDNQLYAVLRYSDGSVEFQRNFVTSAPTPSGTLDTNVPHAGVGSLAADGSALTNDATYGKAIGDWTGATGLTPYTLVLDTAGDAGKAQIVEVEICINYDLTTDSDVLYISSELELGT